MAPSIQDFIRHSPFCVMATSNAEGDCDAPPKGGIPGFVKVLNDIACSFSGISAYLALELVSQCHSEEPFGHAQDKLRDEESVLFL